MFPVWNEQYWLLTDVFAYRVVGWCLPCGRARQRRQAGQCLALLLPSLTGPRCIEPSSTTAAHTVTTPQLMDSHHTQRGLTSHLLPRNWIFLGTHKYFWCPDTNIFAAPGVVCGSQPCGAGVQCWSKFFVWDINWILTFLPWYRYWGWGGGGRCPLDRTMNLGFGRVFLTLLPSFYRIFPFRFTSTESNNSIVFLTTGKKG